MKAIIAEIAEYFGYEQQKNMLIEEQAELIQALNKFSRKGTEAFNNIIEEIADVELMIDQVKYLLDISQDAIDEIKEEKIKRTIEIINKDLKASTYGGNKGVLRNIQQTSVDEGHHSEDRGYY